MRCRTDAVQLHSNRLAARCVECVGHVKRRNGLVGLLIISLLYLDNSLVGPTLVTDASLTFMQLPAGLLHPKQTEKLGEELADSDWSRILRVAGSFGVVERNELPNPHDLDQTWISAGLQSCKEDAKLMVEKRVRLAGS